MASVAQMRDEVRRILVADWDPIGVGDVPQARDEYDEYLPPLLGMLASGTSVRKLSSYLLKIERDSLGLEGDPDRANRVATRLLNIS